ncbi:hypothetical protein QT323_25845 [Escherichia coli]|uniref:hypothetical protein n=1 Tax=Escherichia coli TaxID=562 RepID=UPI00259D0D71|nr:hypothetical protein [Escherichia coli]MDM4965730.1 hypothetical protein [Escherichia coli]MDM4971719.1 hypothetical protein [Escherichia coli]
MNTLIKNITPVFKNCPEMITIASWPRSFVYQKGQSEVSLVIRLIDIIASKYMHRHAEEYCDITGYCLPLVHEISDEEMRDIAEDCDIAITRIRQKIREAENKVTAQENKISELRNAPLQPTGADNPYGDRYSVKDVIEHEMRLLENEKRNCEKTRAACEQAIRLIGTGKNLSHDGDNAWIFAASFDGLEREIERRISLYKGIISAVSAIVTLRNEEIKHIPYSVMAKYNHLRQEYINDALRTLTKHYYSNGSETIRHAMTLQEYTGISMPRIERDAATALLSVHTEKKDIV